MPPHTDAVPLPPPRAARPRCPRCGGPLGRLDAAPPGAAAPAAPRYCGCCGLVLPAAGPDGAAAAAPAR